MSRGLGKLQRAILDALPAHEVEKAPGVYDLKKLREALSQALGRGSYIYGRYSRERNTWCPDPAFAACFSRAVDRLIRRRILCRARGLDTNAFSGIWDSNRWRLPYVRLSANRDLIDANVTTSG